MSDIILDSLKSFLYERQAPEEGILDGTFRLIKGRANINENTNIYKSIFPTYFLMERWRGFKNRIYYKCYFIKKGSNFELIKKKDDCENHYFKKPIGSIHILASILQSN
jgi:hypothetical protein